MRSQTKLTKAGVRSALTGLRMIIIQGLCLFIAAGSIRIKHFWGYLIISIILSLISNVILIRKVPGLLNERGKKQKNIAKWDFYVLFPYFIVLLFGVSITAGLDIGRYGWTEKYFHSFSGGFFYIAFITGTILFIIENIVVTASMLENRHFEKMVRIQEDREHKVVSTGPYSIVRHPGYAAMFLFSIILPFMLGSVFAFIPSLIASILLVIRTYFEDKMLKRELTGYLEYTKKVRSRIIPWIW